MSDHSFISCLVRQAQRKASNANDIQTQNGEERTFGQLIIFLPVPKTIWRFIYKLFVFYLSYEGTYNSVHIVHFGTKLQR